MMRLQQLFSPKNILAGLLGLTVLMSVMYLAEIPPFDGLYFSINPFENTDKKSREHLPDESFVQNFSLKPKAQADEVVVSALQQLKIVAHTEGNSLKNADKLSISESYFSQTSQSYPVKWLLDNKSFAVVSKREQDSLTTVVRIAMYDTQSTPRSFNFVVKKTISEGFKIERVDYEP
jgi:hypothetical protein